MGARTHTRRVVRLLAVLAVGVAALAQAPAAAASSVHLRSRRPAPIAATMDRGLRRHDPGLVSGEIWFGFSPAPCDGATTANVTSISVHGRARLETSRSWSTTPSGARSRVAVARRARRRERSAARSSARPATTPSATVAIPGFQLRKRAAPSHSTARRSRRLTHPRRRGQRPRRRPAHLVAPGSPGVVGRTAAPERRHAHRHDAAPTSCSAAAPATTPSRAATAAISLDGRRGRRHAPRAGPETTPSSACRGRRRAHRQRRRRHVLRRGRRRRHAAQRRPWRRHGPLRRRARPEPDGDGEQVPRWRQPAAAAPSASPSASASSASSASSRRVAVRTGRAVEHAHASRRRQRRSRSSRASCGWDDARAVRRRDPSTS